MNKLKQLLQGEGGRKLIIGIPMVWLTILFLLPLMFVLKISVSESYLAQPPYLDLVRDFEEGLVTIKVNLATYQYLIEDTLYLSALLNSLKIAAISTVIALVIGYPMAYGIARAPTHWQLPLLMLVILPFWTSFLIRVYAWIGILKNNGLLNNVLLWMGVIDQPLVILHTETAIYIGIVYSYLPFMVLPLYATLVRMDLSLLEAAADLGCPPWRQFLSITWPLSLPGVIAGAMLVFIPAVGEFVIPELLGGPNSLMISKLLWMEFFSNKDWPLAASLAVLLLVVLILPYTLWRHYERINEEESHV